MSGFFHLFVASLLATIALFSGAASAQSPCEAVAQAQASAIEAGLTRVSIPADVAYECIVTVPVQLEHSQTLVADLRAFLELDSNIDYLSAPVSGYLWEPVDIFERLDAITARIENDEYSGQYDVETDIGALSRHFHDFHNVFRGDLFQALPFLRQIVLVSVSLNGSDTPRVYAASDIVALGRGSLTQADISEIISVNGLPVMEFLSVQSLVALSHDPDAMWNQALYNLATALNPIPSDNVFEVPAFYPGPETLLLFQNSTQLPIPNIALARPTVCDFTAITTGQDLWDTWQACVEARAAASTTTVEDASTITTSLLPIESPTEIPNTVQTQSAQLSQLPGHPVPEIIDELGLLSGYYLNTAGYENTAVIVIRSFDGQQALQTYADSFQSTLEMFLANAVADGKNNLIIDIQGNGGGTIDLGTELLAQLFPNIPPDQAGNYRASIGLEATIKKFSDILDLLNSQQANPSTTETEQELINEAGQPFAWQSFMTPNAAEFVSFEDLYGPYQLSPGTGEYTAFLQTNYTNTDPSDLDQIRIQITGYGDRQLPTTTAPPFDPANIVLLSDGFCGSTCSIIAELFTNAHQTPSIAIGGRPQTGPMQIVGNSKGSQVFTLAALQFFIDYWFDNDNTGIESDQSKAPGTPFEYWSGYALSHGLLALNAKNNYRIGDDTQTPLQQVYGAADCKIWYTPEMIVDEVAVWSRVAEIAFGPERETFGATGGPYTSQWCVEGSTGHPTSVTGGLKQGTIGDQKVPDNARSQYSGWLLNGTTVVDGFSLARVKGGNLVLDGNVGEDRGSGRSASTKLSAQQLETGLNELREICAKYNGDSWLFELVCGKVG